jgi:hypothetical protein
MAAGPSRSPHEGSDMRGRPLAGVRCRETSRMSLRSSGLRAALELGGSACQTGGMSAAELRLSYRPDDEWHGQLDATVRSGAFSGRGSAWLHREQLKETFTAALRAFPLSASDPPVFEGGFWSKEQSGILSQCHLRIRVRPYNPRGTLLVQVDLATESWDSPDNDQQQSVTARFLVEYAALGEFASHLEEVLDGKRDKAVLGGTAND